MSGETNELRTSSLANRIGLSIVRNRGTGEHTDNHAEGQICGAGPSLSIAEPHYSGYEPNLVPTCHEVYLLKPPVRTVDQRRYPRIQCRNVRACIKTDTHADVIVNLINISRGGVCFTSYAEFYPGTPVSIATHYIEGGQNIFQNGRIVRMQHSPRTMSPGEYAIEFSDRSNRTLAISETPPR